MTPQSGTDLVQRELLDFLEETFERAHGIYLDKGTCLFETLRDVTASEASRRASERSGSIAAHVKHVHYYLCVLQRSIRGEPLGELNWREIWERDRPVTPDEWRDVLEDVRAEYANAVRLVHDPATWQREDTLGGAMAIVVHTAYHLGAVRQALNVIRGTEAAT